MTDIVSKVSIVTPSYNQAKFLERTILSVLNQDYPNIEYIIIDGGSTDGSIDIIRKYEKRIFYWVSAQDKGQSDAINKGFRVATGKIFNWLNADDILLPSAASIAVRYMESDSRIGLVFGNRMVINANDQVISCVEYPSFSSFFFKFSSSFAQETGFFKKDIWNKVGGLDIELHYLMDRDFWFKCMQITQIRHIPFFLGSYRWHSKAKSIVSKDKNISRDLRYKETRLVNQRYLKPIHTIMLISTLMGKINQLRLYAGKIFKSREREIQIITDLL